MEHSRFTEQQIAFVLDQVARGASVEQTCRNAGISLPTYYRWRAKYAGLSAADIRRLHDIEEENERLRQLLATMRSLKQAPAAATPLPSPSRSFSRALVPVPAPAPAMVSRAANGYWRTLAGYLPAISIGNKLDVRGKALALLRHMQSSSVTRTNGPLKLRASVPASGLWGRLQRMIGAHKLLIVCFTGGVVGGFAMGLAPTETDETPEALPVNLNLRISSYGSLTSTMDKGWGGSEPWGRWMEGASAAMLLGLDGPARGDVELLIEGRSRLAEGQPDQTLIVRFNDTELGRWRLPKETGGLRRRFIVPNAVFNQTTAAHLSFALADRAPLSPVFGLEAVSLRDARFLHGYRGFVDNCIGGRLTGWAVAEGVPVSVAASIDGVPLKATLSSVERPDLAQQAIPSGAGFELALATPVASGAAIDVRFPNGRPLSGSPCKP